MTHRERVEGIIADWRRLEASARMRLADGSFPLVLPAEINSCANCALALERLLAVADAAAAVVDWNEPPDEELDRLENAVRAWEEP